MKYLKIYEAKQEDWIKIAIDDFNKIINEALKQNPDININEVSDVLLDAFDILKYYPKPNIQLFFKVKKSNKNWSCEIETSEYDKSEYLRAKSDYYYVENFLNTVKYDKCVILIHYNLWSLYYEDPNIETFIQWQKMSDTAEKNADCPNFDSTKNECYERLHEMGYKTDDGKLFNNKYPKKTEFYVYKEIKYTHKSDTSYLNDLPDNIVKDFHNFIVSKKFNDKDKKTLIDIFKKGLSS